MKLVLCLAIVALSAYIGRLMSKKASQRLILMQQYQSAVIQLCDCVVGRRLPLFLALESCQNEAMRPFLYTCADALKKAPSADFSHIWKEGFNTSELGLGKADAEIILRGGAAIKTLCANPSEKQAAIYIAQVERYLQNVDAEKQKKCKLLKTSGVLAGLLIALLVI